MLFKVVFGYQKITNEKKNVMKISFFYVLLPNKKSKSQEKSNINSLQIPKLFNPS